MSDWFAVENAASIPSPALFLYPDRIRENLRAMIRVVGDATRLRPHIKTHKLAEVVRMQLEEGITKCKCATIAEAEMAAGTGCRDILIAYPMVGPNVSRLLRLAKAFPETKFSCVADDATAIDLLSKAAAEAGQEIDVLLDLDCGQHRTGVEPGAEAFELYRLLGNRPPLRPGGLHAYDGHLHETDLGKRTELCHKAYSAVDEFRRQLLAAGLPVPRVVAGGTPTFPIHAKNSAVECSPGTCVLWDFGYADQFQDMRFLNAAVVLTRVVSKPGANRLCLDLGHKAIAAESPLPRAAFLNLPDATNISHSEEHLVVQTTQADRFAVGACLYAVPRHICPTVALYSEATIVRDGRTNDSWRIVARERRLTF
jgi:D-serine deaminase-like pyridoxal phosphate-dependent protein